MENRDIDRWLPSSNEEDPNSTPLPRYFGSRLRRLRETYPERINQGDSTLPILRLVPSASAVIQCMRESAGFTISGAAYNEIENGLNVPRDAIGFLNAVAHCLRLSADDKADLTKRLAYDLLSTRLRHLTPQVFPPDSSW